MTHLGACAARGAEGAEAQQRFPLSSPRPMNSFIFLFWWRVAKIQKQKTRMTKTMRFSRGSSQNVVSRFDPLKLDGFLISVFAVSTTAGQMKLVSGFSKKCNFLLSENVAKACRK